MTESQGAGRRDDAIASTEGAAEDKAATAARLFDIRRIIGGLFVLYGLILFVTGLVDGADASRQAAGIDINMWTGVGMLVAGLLFLLWMRLNPVQAPEATEDDDGTNTRPTH